VPDVEAVPAEAIGTELVSARAQDKFVAAFETEERQQSIYRVFVEIHRVFLQKRTRRTNGGLEIYWQAPRARCHCHLEGLANPHGRGSFRRSVGLLFYFFLRAAWSARSCSFAPKSWDLLPDEQDTIY